MTRGDVNRASLALSLLFSALAVAVVGANIIAGVQPQPDENTSAHIWQLLMLAQLPLMALFLATARWRDMSPALLFGAQLAAMFIACVPVWMAGY